jgi:MFS family permease
LPAVRDGLRSPWLRRIVAAYTINRLGTWFGYVALSVTVYDHTRSALAVAGLLVAGQAVPAFFVPFVVARVEASKRASPMTLLYVIEAVVTVGLAVLVDNFALAPIIVLVAFDGAIALAASALLRAAAARAARESVPAGATVDDVAEGEDAAMAAERSANATLNIAFSLTFVMGPALAGLVVATAGGSAALLIDAASFLVAAALVVGLAPAAAEGEHDVAQRLAEAWNYLRARAILRYLLLAEGIALIFFASDASIEVPYAKTTLQVGDRGYGLILTVWGIGVGLGSVVFARMSKMTLGVMLTAGSLAVGVAYIGFSVAPSLAAACAAALIGGMGNGVQWAALLSAAQQLTPAQLQGQVMAAVEAIGAFCPGIGLLFGGLLVAVGSPRSAFLVVGLGSAAMALAFIRLSSQGALTPRRDGPQQQAPIESH